MGYGVADRTPSTAGPDVGTVVQPAAHPPPGPELAASVGSAAFAPATVELPAAGIRAPVVPVDVQPDGLLAVPDPPQTVGWWRDGAAPGGPAGSAVLAGHVDSARSGIGAFAALWHASVGDPVVLTAADGSVLRYQVQARRSYRKQDLPAEVFDRGGPARLVLITCGGRFDRGTRHYTDNVVVYATPLPA